MRTNILKAGILTILLIASTVFAEAFGQEQHRRFSISIHGGVSFADETPGGRLGGGFDYKTETNPTFGGSIAYALTPFWSMEIYGSIAKFEAHDDVSAQFDYTTDVIAVSWRNIIHLNQLLGTNRVSNYIGPYAYFGVGALNYDVEAANFPDQDDTVITSMLGLGINFYISRTVDFFVQYDVSFSTNNLDGGPGLNPNGQARDIKRMDSYGTAVAGLRFNFGARDARHASWKRPAPELTQSEIDRLMALNSRMDDLERRVAQNTSDIERVDSELQSATSALRATADDHERRISDLESQFADLDMRVREIEEHGVQVEKDEVGLTQALPDGHYVQIFAALNMETAKRVYDDAVAMLDGVVDNPSEMVLITQRRQFYEVRIGVFNRFPDTANALRTAQSRYSDAFVVTFPRPAHLQEFYRDIQVVD